MTIDNPCPLSKFRFAGYLVLAVAMCAGCSPETSTIGGLSSDRSNVVMIVIDTLRADKLSASGLPFATSPEIDALAKNGVRFMDVFAACSWTRPSSGAMLTGEYPRTLGLYAESDEVLADRFLTLAEVLHDSGYHTYGITANPVINSRFNFDQGFDQYVDSNVVFPWMDVEGDEISTNKTKLHSAKAIFGAVLEAPELKKDGPHFVFINVMDVHEYRKPNRGQTLTRQEYGALFPQAPDRSYLQAVRQASTDVGDFIKTLKRRKGWKNTLFVITSDHGEGLSDHPAVTGNADSHGRVLYESQVKVPLIFHHDRHLVSKKITQRVRQIDLTPTVVDYLGLTMPATGAGVSLMPLFRDEPLQLPDAFIAETRFRAMNKIAAYTDEWKYFHNRDGRNNLPEFELQKAGQTSNGKKTDKAQEFPEVVAELKKVVEQWESDHPVSLPTSAGHPLAPEVVEQLKAIGYID